MSSMDVCTVTCICDLYKYDLQYFIQVKVFLGVKHRLFSPEESGLLLS